MISKRTLEKWRKEALEILEVYKDNLHKEDRKVLMASHILLTQELLDQHLLGK